MVDDGDINNSGEVWKEAPSWVSEEGPMNEKKNAFNEEGDVEELRLVEYNMNEEGDVLSDDEGVLLRDGGSDEEYHSDELEEEWLDAICVESEVEVEEAAPEEAGREEPAVNNNVGQPSYKSKGKEKVGQRVDTRLCVQPRRGRKRNENNDEVTYEDQPMWEEESKMEDIELGLHSSFSDAVVFRYVLKNYAAEQGFDFTYHRNEANNIAIICTQHGCNFWCWCSGVGDGTIMEITAWRRAHSCGRPSVFKKFTASFLAKRYLQLIRDTPTITPKILQNLMYRDIVYKVPMHQVYRTLNRAKEIIAGDVGKQYEDLFSYCEMIRRKNPGSVANLKVCKSDNNRFERIYISYAPQMDGFLAGCRPLVGIDGCHLKGRYGGQLLAAVGWDANNQMFPLAFAVVEQENKASWKWFLEEFFAQYGDDHERGWVFLSDKQKGLVQLFTNWLNGVEHRFCMRHMEENWVLKFRGAAMKARLWACAKATSGRIFEEEMEKLKLLSVDAYDWLQARGPEGWCKAFYSDRACNSVQVNSMSECFNNWIKDGRDLPIYDLCEYIRIKLMELLSERSTQFEDYGGRLCERIQMKLEEIKDEAVDCGVSVCGEDVFEVKKRGRTCVVNLRARTCDCLEWQLNGIPCFHGVAVITKLRGVAEDYVDDYYTMDTYRTIYGRFIASVGSKDTWPADLKFPIVAPPIVQKPPGRPRVRRRKSKGELLNVPYSKSSKRKCTTCNLRGHNARSCDPKDHGETSTQRKLRLGGVKGKNGVPDKQKGKKAGLCTTEAEFTEQLNHRRTLAEQKTSSVRIASERTRECTDAEILAKKQEALRRLHKRHGPDLVGGSSSSKRQKHPTTVGEGTSTTSAAARGGPTIGLAQAVLNDMRNRHVGHFTTLDGESRLGGEAMFTRGTRAQRGRAVGRGGRAAARGGTAAAAARGGTAAAVRGGNASRDELTSSQPPPASTPLPSSLMNASSSSQQLP